MKKIWTISATVCTCLLCGFTSGRWMATADRAPLTSELQNESFCPLSWELDEFRVKFARDFQILFLNVLQMRAHPTSKVKLDNGELAEVLEDVIAKAEHAVPVSDLKEGLLEFYRAARLTNKFLALRTELERTNPRRFTVIAEKAFLKEAHGQ